MDEAQAGPIKVLVIDDSNTIRRSAEMFLRQAGFVDVQRCEFGRSAVEGLAIDLPNHAPYSLYVEAVKPAAALARAANRPVPAAIGAPAVAGASCRTA